MPRAARPKKLCRCGRPSLPALRTALCAFHYAERMWGTAWALSCAGEDAHVIHAEDESRRRKASDGQLYS